MTPHELIEMASQLTGKLFDMNGEMRAVYMIENDDSLNLMSPPPLPKDAAIEVLKDLMKHMGATGYVFVNEAWVVEGDKADASIPPEKHPRRKEQIIFIAETDSETLFAHRDIIRPTNGKPTLGPLQIETGLDSLSGRMTGLLRDRPERLH
jgi:hypothetical protein